MEVLIFIAAELFEAYSAFQAVKATAKTVHVAAKTAALLVIAANGEYDWKQMEGKLHRLEQKLEEMKTFKPATIGHPECALVAAPSVRAVVPIGMNLHAVCTARSTTGAKPGGKTE